MGNGTPFFGEQLIFPLFQLPGDNLRDCEMMAGHEQTECIALCKRYPVSFSLIFIIIILFNVLFSLSLSLS